MHEDKLCAMFMCPATGLEMNGKFHFLSNFTSGKVVSERTVKVLQKNPVELSDQSLTDKPLAKKSKTDETVTAFKN